MRQVKEKIAPITRLVYRTERFRVERRREKILSREKKEDQLICRFDFSGMNSTTPFFSVQGSTYPLIDRPLF